MLRDYRMADGTEASLTLQEIQEYAATAAANVPIVIDTQFKPVAGRAAYVRFSWMVDDRVTPRVTGATDEVSVRATAGGVLTIAQQVHGSVVGDAGLATTALVFSVSASNTLVATITPPAAYPQALFASAKLTVVQD